MTVIINPNRVNWIEEQPRRPLCDVPWLGASVVLSDGNVNFCCYSSSVIGNVKKQSFEQIWNGLVMRRIRQSLSEHRLPPECQSTSCPFYRGDSLHGIFERMEGPNRFQVTKTHDPHSVIRERLHGSELLVNNEEMQIGDTLEVKLEFHYTGEPIFADLFVGIRYPDGVIRFLPNFEEYAVPFSTHIEFREDKVPLRFKVLKQHLDSATIGDYHICAALFERDSNPNLLSNCYWSASKTVKLKLGKATLETLGHENLCKIADYLKAKELTNDSRFHKNNNSVGDKMRNEPLVSAIIIFLNGEKFIREAIESVFAQTYDNWELLLVDDGSTDASTEIALRYAEQYPVKVRYLEHEGHQNRGMSASRNLGLHHAKGEYIALLDHDDVWLPSKLKDQVAILEAQPEAGMMYGRTRYWHSWTGRPEDRERDGFTFLGIQPDTLVKPPHLVTLFLRDERTIASTCSILIRREVAERVGGFDETFRDQYEDMVFLTKVYLDVPVFVAGGCWDCYRQHPNNSSAVALRTGQWHPGKPNPSRELFLYRVEQCILEKGVTDVELLDALRAELRAYRHPEECTPRQKFYYVCIDASLALVRGEDARPLLRALGDVHDPKLDGHTVAEWLFDAMPLSTGRSSSVWVELWPKLKNRIDEYLKAMERQAQSTGLAREVHRILERMIECKWLFRVAGGNIASLIFPPDIPDMVRIAIKKVETKNSFDIQLNMPRLKVKSKHCYAVVFRARADSQRNIIVGFAKAYESWDNLGLYKNIELKAEWQNYDIEFVATADDDNARIHFDIGDSDISVELSSVSLRSLLDGQIIKPDIPHMHTNRERAVKEQTGQDAGREDVQDNKIKGVAMRILGINRLRRAVQQFRHRFERKAIILMYHRVAEVHPDPWSLCVTPQHFAEHLEILKKHFRPIRLQQLTKALRKGKVPRRSVVVTFDDGYADNLHNARPLLECRKVPATVFLSTGYIGQGREFWWDELDRLLLQPGTLPETLHLCINGSAHQWSLGEAAHYDADACWRYSSWRALEEAPSHRHLIYRSLWQLLQPLPESERRKVLNELLVWASAEPEGRPAYRILTQHEVVALARGGLVEVGAHTVTHPMISTLPTALQRDEIQQSKTSLEKILGRPVISFAYPYGNYSAETVPIVREAGFTCACSTLPGVVGRDNDRFQLPRVQIEDWDGEEFSRKLSLWFDG